MSRRLPGIIYPSTVHPGGANIVLFPDNAIAGTVRLIVLDPAGEIAAANPARLI